MCLEILCLHYMFNLLQRVRRIAKSNCYLRHVCLSVRVEQLGSHWTNFLEV